MQPVQRVYSGTAWEKEAAYCRALRVGSLVFVAGTTAVDETGAVVGPGDVEAQAAFIFQTPHVFCQGVWRSPQGVEASLCGLKAWQHTWLLAPPVQRVQGPSGLPRPARRELYLRALEHAQGDGDFRWAVALVEAEDPWLRPVHTQARCWPGGGGGRARASAPMCAMGGGAA